MQVLLATRNRWGTLSWLQIWPTSSRPPFPDSSLDAQLHWLGPVFANITQNPLGRKVVLNRKRFAFQRLLRWACVCVCVCLPPMSSFTAHAHGMPHRMGLGTFVHKPLTNILTHTVLGAPFPFLQFHQPPGGDSPRRGHLHDQKHRL